MATYTVRSGDTLSKIGAKLGVDWRKITGFKSGNPNLIFPGEVLTLPGGGGKSKAKPKTKKAVQPFLTKGQLAKAKKGAVPKVRTQAQILAGLEKQGLESVDLGERPEVPSLRQSYEDLRAEQGVETLETRLLELRGAEDEIIATLRQRSAAQRDRGALLNVVEGRIGEIERQERENLDFVQRQKSRVVEELDMIYGQIEILMKYMQLDYTNALNAYNQAFKQNLDMINLVRDIQQDDKDDIQQAIDNAMARLQITSKLVADGKINLKSYTSSERIALAKMEIAAGFSPGFLSKIDGRIISTSTLSNGQTQVVIKHPNGTITVKRMGTPLPKASTGGGGSTKFAVTGTVLKQGAAILKQIDATASGKGGTDKKLTSTEYGQALKKAISTFGNLSNAKKALQLAWDTGGWKKSFADGIDW